MDIRVSHFIDEHMTIGAFRDPDNDDLVHVAVARVHPEDRYTRALGRHIVTERLRKQRGTITMGFLQFITLIADARHAESPTKARDMLQAGLRPAARQLHAVSG